MSLQSRDGLVKGGQSGEPAVIPGYGEDSPLLHYIAGEIEDLEMPPLDKRGKYPALNEAEIELLRAWIDGGAPWSTDPVAVAAPGGEALALQPKTGE